MRVHLHRASTNALIPGSLNVRAGNKANSVDIICTLSFLFTLLFPLTAAEAEGRPGIISGGYTHIFVNAYNTFKQVKKIAQISQIA